MLILTSPFECLALVGLHLREGLDLLLNPLRIDESLGIWLGRKSSPALINICWSRDRQVE